MLRFNRERFRDVKFWGGAICVASLLLMACLMLFRTDLLRRHTVDGYTFSYLIDQEFLGYFHWIPAKLAGRPFVGVPYRLAHDLLGGSVADYNLLQIGCVVTSALGVFFIIRLLWPSTPRLAWTAGVLKLAWPLNHHLLFNHSLNIAFAEMLFVLAVLSLAWCLRGRSSRSGWFYVLHAAIFGLVFVATNTYQTLWPLISLLPVLVSYRSCTMGRICTMGRSSAEFGTFASRIIDRRSVRPLVAWYVSFVVGAGFSLWHLSLYPTAAPAGARTTLANWTSGTFHVLTDSLWRPWLEIHASDTSAGVFAGVAVSLLYAAVALGLRKQDGDAESGGPKAAWGWLAAGVFLVLVTLLPPSVRAAAAWGNRFGTLAVYGWLIGMVALLAIGMQSRRSWQRMAASLLAVYLVFTWSAFLACRTDRDARRAVRDSIVDLRLIENLSGVEEGTLVTLRGLPPRGPLTDVVFTNRVRMFSDTFQTFTVNEGHVRSMGDELAIHTPCLLDTPMADEEEWSKRARRVSFSANAAPTAQRRFSDRRVAFRWNAAFQQWVLDAGKSNPSRLGPRQVRPFSRTLFPDCERWLGGSFFDTERYKVLAQCEASEPVRFAAGVDWYPAGCGLAVTARANCREDGVLVRESRPVEIEVHVPPGPNRRVAFSVEPPGAVLAVGRAGQGAESSRAGSGARHRSPELRPGYHTLQVQLQPGSASEGRSLLHSFQLHVEDQSEQGLASRHPR